MSASPPPRRTTRGEKFVGSSDEEEFCNEPPRLRKKAYSKKKPASDNASEGTDSGVESRAQSPKSPSSSIPASMPECRLIEKSALLKNTGRSVVEQANAAFNHTHQTEQTIMCGCRLPSAAELAEHFRGKDFGEYDNGSVTLVRQYGIGLFAL